MFTGYYEPELNGSLTRSPRYAYPLYRRPPELRDGQVFHDRASIEAGALRGRGLELAWLEDPVEVYFLHIQGSGRIRLPDGQVMRVGYGGRNGHAYRSIGQEMIRRGSHTPDQVSAQEIRSYVRNVSGKGLLNLNPSYVFFRKIETLEDDMGPIGAMTRPITAMRSVAIDPDYTPLGVPVVPPVGMMMNTSSRSATTSGRVAGSPPHHSSSAGASAAALSCAAFHP